MKNSTISVVVPLYNKAVHVLRSLQSITGQTYAAKEIIVVDDGSTDNGAELVKAAGIPNLRLISQTNGGVSKARNTGIEAATGEFIAFLDADDEWMPLFLEQMMELAERFPVAGAFASRYQYVVDGEKFKDAKIVDTNTPHEGGLLEDFFDIASRGDLPFLVCTMLVRKEVVDNIGGFPEGEPMGEDQDFMCRIAERYHVAYSKNINMLYHTEATNRACERNLPEQECPFSQRIMQRLAQQELKPEAKTSRIRFCAAHICHLAKRNMRAGNVKVAMRLLSDKRVWSKPVHKVVLMLSCLAMLPLARA